MPNESEEPNIRPRDRLLRDTFTPAEAFLYGTILLTAFGTFVVGDPRSFWLLGALMIVGGLSPILLKTHEQTHPFFVDFLWPKVGLITAPMWLLLIQFLAGITQDPIQTLEIEKASYQVLSPPGAGLPVSTAARSNWIVVCGLCAAYVVAANLFIVPKSRSFFERLFPWLCSGAVLIGVFGFLQKAMQFESVFLTEGTGRSDFFAVFPYDGHWAAFALLWCGACIGMALLNTRYDDSGDFVHSTGPWYLTGAVILGGSAFLIESRWPAAILLLGFSALLLVVTISFLSESTDKHRGAIATGCGLLATVAFAGGLFRIFQNDAYQAPARSLRVAAKEMFMDRPLFGWGFDSFTEIAPFYADDFLTGTRYDRAASDVLQFLAEVGVIGCLLPLVLGIYLLFRYVIGRHDIHLTNHLLIGCLGVFALAFVDTPFMSPSVFFSFFIIFFAALRWADLSRNKVDEVDARPTLVLHPSERNVPFFNDHAPDVEK